MKKILALVLAMMLVLSMSAVAFADGETTEPSTTPTPAATQSPADYEDLINKDPTFTKTYNVVAGVAPAEDFTFNFAFESYTNPVGEENVVTASNAPVIDPVIASYAASDTAEWTATKTLTIPVSAEDFPFVGKYVYSVTETDNNTEGVDYTTSTIKLVVTVMHNTSNTEEFVAVVHLETLTGTKTVGVTNKYNAGSLAISKTITGNMADMTKKFPFTVTFTAGDNDVIRSTITSNATAAGVTDLVANGNTYTFSLGHNQTLMFSNLPVGTIYTVSENPDNYTSSVTYSDQATTKTISANAETGVADADSVAFVNDLTSEVDTGISLDNMPYVIIMGLVVLAGAAMLMKKRSYND